jgi:hypothetical protein
MTKLFKIVFASILLFPLASFAHHSFFGRFDMDTSVIMQGEVTEIHWRNPHVHIFVDTTDENGEVTSWDFESGSPTLMQRAGIPRDAIQVGQTIQAAVYPPLTDKLEAFATNILLPDGQELVMQTGAQAQFNDQSLALGDFSYRFRTEGDRSRPELGLFRVWTFAASYGFLFPESINRNFDLLSYPLTDSAKEVLAAFNPATDNPTQNCAIKGMPLIMEQPVPMEIIRQGDNVALRLEEYDLIRTINMDREAAPANQEYSLMGYSVGHWEGETLVTTTTHINFPWFNQSGIPLSTQAVIEERFTSIEDGSLMDYEMKITDPVNFTETVTLSKKWLHVAGLEVLPFECEEAETI